ncbi:MAG: FecR domain-containing protein [Myxococcales bacterium]|nr:FecR domain-containing protein [Myxococcales bacterium]
MAERREEVLARLRDLDEALARRSPSPQSREQLRRRLHSHAVEQRFAARLRWWPALAFAAGAVTMVLLLARGPGSEPVTEPSTERAMASPSSPASSSAAASREAPRDAEATAGAGAEAVAGADPRPAGAAEPACERTEASALDLPAHACVARDGVRVSALLDAHLQWEGDRIELRGGAALFEVEPRPARPLRVAVGELEIEVVGTRFVVHDGEAPWVSVLEGHVRVRVGQQAPRDLRDGQRFDAPSPGLPAKRARRPARGGDEELAALLDEVARLRGQGAYREAVERLRASDGRGFGRRARQVVSYELGTLLERQLGDVAGACAHWAEHQRRYPSGRYAQIVARAQARLGCTDAP